MKYISIILVITIFIIGYFNSLESKTLKTKNTTIKFKNYVYDVKSNSFIISKDKSISNPYELSLSSNKKYIVFTKVKNYDAPEVYIHSFDKNKTSKLTDNIFIEINPVVNDIGNYAYAQTEYSVSSSKVYLDNQVLKESKSSGLSKNLAINNKYLIYNHERLYDGKHFLHWFELDTKRQQTFVFKGYIQKINFLSTDKVLIQYYAQNTMSMDIGIFDLKNSIFKTIKHSDKDELIKDVNYDQNFTIATINNNETNIKLLFNAYYNYYNYQLANPFAYSNNYLGRISWNVAYRLKNMVSLYKITRNQIILIGIDKTIQALLDRNNEKIGINGDYNYKYSYAVKKYSIDKNTPISQMVADARIYSSILFAVNSIGGSLKEKYQQKLKDYISGLFDYYENYYDTDVQMYKFQYGMPFYLDGIWLPFNMQNSFGIVLLEIYKLTEDQKFKRRAFELAQKFKSEFVYKDNKLIWHYLPSQFYTGWEEDENLSTHTPQRSSRENPPYEDLSHAGININFILKFYSYFPDEVFTSQDIDLLQNTINEFIYDKTFSRFMDGDILYQKAQFRFLPSSGWGLLNNKKLNNFYISLNPYFYPDFDSQGWDKYLEAIDVNKVQDENISIVLEIFNIHNIRQNSKKNILNYTNIQNYFEY